MNNKSASNINPSAKFIDLSVERIRSGLETFPAEYVSADSIADLKVCSRSTKFNNLGVIVARDGLVALYTKQGSLADWSHRFIVPGAGDIQYHRDSFNIDFQAIGSPPLNLVGSAEIAGNVKAQAEYYWMASRVLEWAHKDWADTQNNLLTQLSYC